MKRSIVFAAAVTLAACSGHGAGNNQQAGSSGGVTGAVSNAVSGAVSAVGAGASHIQPGRWETTVRIVRLDMPDAPPQMRERLNRPTTSTACVTPEQAADPFQNMTQGMEGQGCNSNNFSMANGRISGSINCPAMQMSFNGTFTATTYDATVQAHSSQGGHTMDMETHSTARRVGECNGTEDTGGARGSDSAPPPAAPGGAGGK